MSTILESVNTLSEKLGVTEREQTIKDQLDLCVERLGGEGNSKDIAESAEKFAEKEDGTATFMTKTITENNTYNAADDGVSGYSSVTVNVPSGGETFEFSVTVTAEKTGEEQMPATLVSNKTYSEIVSAFNNGDKLKPTITINTIDGGETITSILTVAVCTLTELGLWLCGCEDFDSAVYSIIWIENATTGMLIGSEAEYIVIAS